MTLRYIALQIEDEISGRMYSSDFAYHTRFISNYFSKAIRKYKYTTDGTFNMISIKGAVNYSEGFKIRGMGALSIPVSFDPKRYEQIKGTEDCSYYLELLEQGFKKASEFKPIPLDTLLTLIEEFKKGGCKNEWVHKKKRFKDIDLEVILKCEFTTNYFQLIATINQISTKKELVKGIVMKTKPDAIHFDKMFKDVLVYENFIIITDACDSAMALINIEDARNGIFNKIFAPYIYSEDYTLEENQKYESDHNEVIKILSYDGSGF